MEGTPRNRAKLGLDEAYGKLPLAFELNEGQTDSRVKFLSRGRGYRLFLTGDEAVLTLPNHKIARRKQNALAEGKFLSRGPKLREDALAEGLLPPAISLSLLSPGKEGGADPPSVGFASINSLLRDTFSPLQQDQPAESLTTLRLWLTGANPHAQVVGLDELPGESNYFIGNDPKKWRTNVPNYAKVKYQSVYPGIDLVYYGNQRQLEYDFVVAPGADSNNIRFEIVGAGLALPSGAQQPAPLRINERGDLVIPTDAGDVRLHKPVVYQPVSPLYARRASGGHRPPLQLNPKSQIPIRKLLDGRYVVRPAKSETRNSKLGNPKSQIQNPKYEVSFEITSYDPSLPLIIDPVLSYSTYLGGSGDDSGWSIAVDTSGDAYITGTTVSSDFPKTIGVYDPTCGTDSICNGGFLDAFVTKLDSSGALVYSTYLGGSNHEIGIGVAVDASGNGYVTGLTDSTDFPTMSPLQASLGGAQDAFVVKLKPGGDGLLYSTYLGGSGSEAGRGIRVDSSGDAYVAGWTTSTDFHTNTGAYQTSCGDFLFCVDAFVTKLNPGGNTLLYSTYLGGNGTDQANSIAIDASGNAYVAGFTDSSNFPTPNAFQTSSAGGSRDAFLTKLNNTGSLVLYSTYLGGTSEDRAEWVAVDTQGNAYVTGTTQSSDFPRTNPFQSTLGGSQDAFVAKLNPALSGSGSLLYSTYLGGTGTEEGRSIAVDTTGNAYVTGFTDSTNFPIFNSIQGTNGGSFDAFVTKFNASGSHLISSTYLGGTGIDGGSTNNDSMGIAVDSSGNAYVLGKTDSTNFPTANPLQSTNAGGSDAFVAKLSGLQLPVVTLSPTSLAFADQAVGTSSTPQAVSLTNVGDAALSISGVALVGTNAADFAASADTCSGATVAPGGNCTVSVTFTPTAAGTRMGTLTITDNAAGSPQTAALTGTGVISTGGTPAVSLSRLDLYFGNPAVGTTAGPQTVTLKNTGTGPLTISRVTPSLASFFESDTCGSSVAPGVSCTISLTFTPSTAGTVSGSVAIVDNAADSPQTLSLTGIGMNPFYQFEGLPDVPAPSYDSSTDCVTQSYGCALTASGSVLTTFTSSITPLSLDQFLKQNGGYDSDCGLLFRAIPGFPALGGSVQLVDSLQIQGQPANDYLTSHLVGQRERVILQLCEVASDGSCKKDTQGTTLTHFIIATSPIGTNDWQVFDPGWSAATPQGNLSTLSGHLAGFTTAKFHQFKVIGVRTFVPSTGPAALSVQALSPVELVVTDPQGRRVGNDGGTDVFEIPLASYFRDYPLEDDNGDGLALGDPSGIKTAYIPSPLEGTYMVEVTGAATGTYTLTFQATATDGTIEQATLGGTTIQGAVTRYQVTYSSTPGTPLTVTALPNEDYSLATNVSSRTITAGQSATFNLSVMPQGGFNQTVSLTCTRVPQLATCTVSPASVTPDGANPATATVTITTTARGSAPPTSTWPQWPDQPLRWTLLAGLLAMALMAALAAGKRLRPQAVLVLLLFCLLVYAGCGGGGSTSPAPKAGTPAGTYTLTITGTSGSLSHSTTVTLTVN